MKKKSKSYNVVISQETYDRHILVILKAVGKFLVESSDKLLKAKEEKTKWEWKAPKGKK